MIVTPMSLTEYFNLVSEKAEYQGYNWILMLIGRCADAEDIYDKIEKTWTSLNDLTNDRIAFVFSSALHTRNNGFYRTPNKAPYIGRMCPFAKMIGEYRFQDTFGDFEMYIQGYNKHNWKDLHTQSITEFIRANNISERDLPGIFIFNIKYKKNIYVQLDMNQSLYDFIKYFVIETEKIDRNYEYTISDRNLQFFQLEEKLNMYANSQGDSEKQAVQDVMQGTVEYKVVKELIRDKKIRTDLKKYGQWKRHFNLDGSVYLVEKNKYLEDKRNEEKKEDAITIFLDELCGKESFIERKETENVQMISSANNKKYTIIFIVDDWGFSKGGINVFNRLLCEAMGQIDNFEVVCVSENISNDEMQLAIEKGVKLLNVSTDDFLQPSEIITSLQNYIGLDGKRIVFVGHDVKTGKTALGCRDELQGSNCAIIHHMAYSEYYPILNRDSDISEIKEEEQREVLKRADIVFANGPVLEKSAQDIVGRKVPVIKVLPGVSDVLPREEVNNTFSVVAFGRVEQGSGLKKNNSIIKQTYLAVASWANFVEKYNLGNESIMKIYGKNQENSSVDEEMDALVNKYLSSLHAISAVKYEENRKKLLERLSEFSLCMVLSLREGFGLTALEAISAGVPLIVSKTSGFYNALEELRLDSYVLGVDICGSNEYPFYSDADLDNVSLAIYRIYRAQKDYKSKALELRDKLMEAGFTWSECAATMVENIIKLEEI